MDITDFDVSPATELMRRINDGARLRAEMYIEKAGVDGPVRTDMEMEFKILSIEVNQDSPDDDWLLITFDNKYGLVPHGIKRGVYKIRANASEYCNKLPEEMFED